MNLLALDQAAITGWAVWADDRYHHGVWRFDKIKSPGERSLQFVRNLRELHAEHELAHIAYEEPHLGDHGNAHTAKAVYGWVTLIEAFCASEGLPVPIGFPTQTWRSKVYGKGKVFPRKGFTGNRKKWHLNHAFELCEELGLDVKAGDEAEAVAILEALRAELFGDVAAQNRERITGQRELFA